MRGNTAQLWIQPFTGARGRFISARDEKNTYIEGYPNTLYIIKLDSSGKEVFRTYLFGGKGHGPGKSWFDGRSKARSAYNGKEFGVYFEVQKNWADPGQEEDIHNGDMFVVVSGKGEVLEDRTHFWTASHSSTIQVAAGRDNQFYTMTIGDAYPYGLQFYNRNKDKSLLLWPPEEDYIPYEEVNSTNAAGILEFFAPRGDDFIALMGTLEHPNIGVFDKVDVLFMRISPEGSVKNQRWLVRSPDQDESVITAAPLGKGIVIGWGKGNDYDDDWKAGKITLCMIDPAGQFLIPPSEYDFPFGTYSQFCKTASGAVLWTLVDNGRSRVDVYRITEDSQ